MYRQKSRLQGHLEQIVKDKEAITAKIEALVSDAEQSISAALLIADAKKFRKENAAVRTKIDNALKIIDRLFLAVDDEDDDENDDDDDDAAMINPDDTLASTDLSTSMYTQSVAGVTSTTLNVSSSSDLIRLAFGGSSGHSPAGTAPALTPSNEASSLSVPTNPPSLVPLDGTSPVDDATRSETPQCTNEPDAVGTTLLPFSASPQQSDSQVLVSTILEAPKLSTNAAIIDEISPISISPAPSSGPDVQSAKRDNDHTSSIPNRDLLISTPNLEPTPDFPEIRENSFSFSSIPLIDSSLSPVDFASESFSAQSSVGRPGDALPSQPISQSSLYDASVARAAVTSSFSFVDSRSSSRGSVHCVDNSLPPTTLLFQNNNDPTSSSFTSKYGPKKAKVPRAHSQCFLQNQRSFATPQSAVSASSSLSTILHHEDETQFQSSLHITPLPVLPPRISTSLSSISDPRHLRHCIKSSFRLNVFGDLNRHFVMEAVKVERRFVDLDRCVLSNFDECGNFPAYLWVTVAAERGSSGIDGVYLTEEEITDLDRIIDDMCDFYNGDDARNLTVASIEEDLICAVRDASDGSWLRGKVHRVSKSANQVEVVLLDFGKFVVVPTAHVFPLLTRFVLAPCRTLPCRLRGVGPNVNSDGTRDWKSFNERLAKALDFWQSHDRFKLKAAFKFVCVGLEEMLVDIRWPTGSGDAETTFAQLLIEKGVGVAYTDGELIEAVLRAKETLCSVHGENDIDGNNNNHINIMTEMACPEMVPAVDSNIKDHANQMRHRVIGHDGSASLPVSRVDASRPGHASFSGNVYVKSLKCSAEELFFHPPKPSLLNDGERKIRFAFTWVESLWIESPEFYITLEKNLNVVVELTLFMEQFYRETPRSDYMAGFEPRVGEFVVVYCPDYDNFYRACVRDIYRGNEQLKYRVYYIDYGNYEWKTLDEMAPLLEHFAILPPQCVLCKPWPRLLPARFRWQPEDGERIREIVNMEKIYSGRIGGVTPGAPISLDIDSEDALELEVLMQDPETDAGVGPEVTLNEELVRRGIASMGSPARSSAGSSTLTGVEMTRDPVNDVSIRHSTLESFPSSHSEESPLLNSVPPLTFSLATECVDGMSMAEAANPLDEPEVFESDDFRRSDEENEKIHAERCPDNAINLTTIAREANLTPVGRAIFDEETSNDRTIASEVNVSVALTNKRTIANESLISVASNLTPVGHGTSTDGTIASEVNIPGASTNEKIIAYESIISVASNLTPVGRGTSNDVTIASEVSVSGAPMNEGTIADESIISVASNMTPVGRGTPSAMPPLEDLEESDGKSVDDDDEAAKVPALLTPEITPPTSPQGSSSSGHDSSNALDSQPPNENPNLTRSSCHRESDNFLKLKSGEWYLCEVVSFVHPENFCLRFPFGDVPLKDFQQQEDADSIFAIFPSTAEENDGAAVAAAEGSGKPIRCLQRDIDRFCSNKAAAGEFLDVEEKSDNNNNNNNNDESVPLRIGARVFSRQENGAFFRSVIRGFDGDDVVNVFLMDFGGCVRVPRKKGNFVAIPSEIDSVPRMALRSRLANVRPKGGSWTLESINWFIDQVISKDLIAHVISTKYDRLIVDLWDTSHEPDHDSAIDTCGESLNNVGDVLINASIVANGFAEPWSR